MRTVSLIDVMCLWLQMRLRAVILLLRPWGRVRPDVSKHLRVSSVNVSPAEPLAVTGLVAVSGNCHILFHLIARHRAPLHWMTGVCQRNSKGPSLSNVSHCVLLSSYFCCLLNCRLESHMSKSAANHRSPCMVTESSKPVTSAAVDSTSGSKVSPAVCSC